MPTKVKVPVATLITGVEAKIQATKDALPAQVAEWQEAEKEYKAAWIVYATGALAAAKNGDYSRFDRYHAEYPHRKLGSKPTLSVGKFEHDLKVLKACTDEFISVEVGSSEWSAYL